MERYVALLRGVNVGGKNKLPMASLKAMFSAAKCKDVSSYIQSGNVVFSAEPKAVAKLGTTICDAIQKQHGFQTCVIIRSFAELERAAKTHPWLKRDVPLDKLHIVFLADEPAPDRAASLDPQRSPADEFALIGSEIYLYLPNGVANSKLTNAYFDSKLKTVTTSRNWNTLQKLLEMIRISK